MEMDDLEFRILDLELEEAFFFFWLSEVFLYVFTGAGPPLMISWELRFQWGFFVWSGSCFVVELVVWKRKP